MERVEYRIEEIKEDDLPYVIRINEAVLPENYPFYFYEMLYRNYPRAFLVAKVGEKVVGYVMSRVEHSLHMSGFLPSFIKRGHIVSIAILPEYRRRGIGTELMIRVLSSLENVYGCKEVYLEVRVSNRPAIEFYRKLGFRIDHVIRHYYKDGEDAYVMVKKL